MVCLLGQNKAMSSLVNVAFHPSQSPAAVRRALVESLRSRKVNHKFHYDSFKQAQKWLALHQAWSPSRTDPECGEIYDRGFESAARQITARSLHVVGLGCGGGQKDARLLALLKQRGAELDYTPSDVSVAMVLVAREAARAVVSEAHCFPLVCDLAVAEDLPEALESLAGRDAARLFTFFGMIPNFEPGLILPRLSALVRRQDTLLFSANLVPGPDPAAGMKRILPQYDNPLTRDWLMTFLLDLGVEREDGELRFTIEGDPAGSGLQRIVATFHFSRLREIRVDTERFDFEAGAAIRLFFSYRYSPGLVGELLARQGLAVREQWITQSGEEGVFRVEPQGGKAE
jgi:L-histidine N-alpha-methyltransferase